MDQPDIRGKAEEAVKTIRGNYERMQESGRLLFLNYDPEKLCRRLSITPVPEGIPLRYLGEMHLVRLPDGEVLDSAGREVAATALLTAADIAAGTALTAPNYLPF